MVGHGNGDINIREAILYQYLAGRFGNAFGFDPLGIRAEHQPVVAKPYGLVSSKGRGIFKVTLHRRMAVAKGGLCHS